MDLLNSSILAILSAISLILIFFVRVTIIKLVYYTLFSFGLICIFHMNKSAILFPLLASLCLSELYFYFNSETRFWRKYKYKLFITTSVLLVSLAGFIYFLLGMPMNGNVNDIWKMTSTNYLVAFFPLLFILFKINGKEEEK